MWGVFWLTLRLHVRLRVAEVHQICELDDGGQQLVKAAMTQPKSMCESIVAS